MGQGIERPRVEFVRDWIPKWVGFAMGFFFLLCFQFCQPVYMPLATEMYSARSLLREDILFAGFCSLTGMSLIFPALFQLKFRFTAKSVFLAMIPVIIACNLITMNTCSRFVLGFVSLIGGTARMFCIFECFSNIQLDISPTRDMNPWLMFLYSVILGVMQFANIIQANIAWRFDWTYMNWFIIGLLLFVWLIVILFTKHFRAIPKIAIGWLDWYGWGLWVIVMISIIFVCQYGEHFDWFASPYIRLAALIGLTALFLNIRRMHTYKAPYITPEVFRYQDMLTMFVLFLLYDLFKGTQTLFQTALLGDVLGFDRLNIVRANWWGWAGIMLGGMLSYVWFKWIRGSVRMIVFASFVCATLYQVVMYFILDQRTSLEYVFVPTLLLTAGEMILYCALTIHTYRVMPLYFFFQGMTFFGFSRVACAPSVSTALFGRILKYVLPKNFALITSEFDAVNPVMSGTTGMGGGGGLPSGGALGQVYGEMMEQTMLASMKEIIGWVAIAGVILLIVILLWKRRPLWLPAPLRRLEAKYDAWRERRLLEHPLPDSSISPLPFIFPDQMTYR